MKKITHAQYMQSPYWKSFSKKILDDENVECYICHRKKWSVYKKATKKHKIGDKKRLIVLTLHHINYDNLGTGKDNVIPICRRCHQLAHDIEKASHDNEVWVEVYKKLLEISKWEYTKPNFYEVPDDFQLSKSKDKTNKEENN